MKVISYPSYYLRNSGHSARKCNSKINLGAFPVVVVSNFSADFVPTLAAVSPVFPHSYMSHECGVTQKYRSATPSNKKVPQEVYQKLAFKSSNFRNGYFNFKLENGGKEIRVCYNSICFNER